MGPAPGLTFRIQAFQNGFRIFGEIWEIMIFGIALDNLE
jgi:hypothetical protein